MSQDGYQLATEDDDGAYVLGLVTQTERRPPRRRGDTLSPRQVPGHQPLEKPIATVTMLLYTMELGRDDMVVLGRTELLNSECVRSFVRSKA